MSSPVLVLTHPLFLQHQPGRGHPESPLRLSRTLEYLEEHRLPTLEFRQPRMARIEEIARVHEPELIEEFTGLAGAHVAIDPDTFATVQRRLEENTIRRSPRTAKAASRSPSKRAAQRRRVSQSPKMYAPRSSGNFLP